MTALQNSMFTFEDMMKMKENLKEVKR